MRMARKAFSNYSIEFTVARASPVSFAKMRSNAWSLLDAAVTTAPNVSCDVSSLSALVDEFQAVRLQNAFDLAAGMQGPRSGRVELDISLPVLESLARLADLLIGEGDVIMRIGVGRSQLQSCLVGKNGFLHAAGFIQHIA